MLVSTRNGESMASELKETSGYLYSALLIKLGVGVYNFNGKFKFEISSCTKNIVKVLYKGKSHIFSKLNYWHSEKFGGFFIDLQGYLTHSNINGYSCKLSKL